MGTGERIRYHRLKSGMTQRELANGIIAVSYLSKIENDQVEASEDIIFLLCERLDIDLREKIDEEVAGECENWFTAILHSDIDKAEDLLDLIQSKMDSVDYFDLFKIVEIHKIRYYILKKELDHAWDQIQLWRRQLSHFTKKEEYYWYKFLGNYEYAAANFEKSYHFYHKALKTLNHEINVSEEEINDLYYSLGVVSSKVWNTHKCLKFATDALEYYQRSYHFKRCVECHILIGISYRRQKEYKKAITSYHSAKHLAVKLEDILLISLCEQNIGHLYSSENKRELAISEFEQCYIHRRENNPIGSLIPIFSLVKEFKQLGDSGKAIFWLEKGEDVIRNHGIHLTEPIALDLKIYHFLLKEYNHQFEQFMLEMVLPFYQEKNNRVELKNNYKLLANYYYDDRKYKSAYKFLLKSIEI